MKEKIVKEIADNVYQEVIDGVNSLIADFTFDRELFKETNDEYYEFHNEVLNKLGEMLISK
jgi:hypothetical protein